MDTASYIGAMYHHIDDLIVKQRSYFTDWQNPDQEKILEIQEQINQAFEMVKKAKERAMGQIMYNQLMIQNANKHRDGRKSDEVKEFVFLTVNPPDQLPYQKLVKAVEQFSKLSVVKRCQYAFEQRGEVIDDFHGFHVHILFERAKKPSECKKEWERIFLPLVPDRAKIKFWSQHTLDKCKGAIGYLSGIKDDEKKASKIENDVAMRIEYGLKDLYVVGDPLTC